MTSRSSDTIEIFFKEYPNCGMTLIPQRIPQPQPQPQSFDDRYRNRNSGSGSTVYTDILKIKDYWVFPRKLDTAWQSKVTRKQQQLS